MGSLGHALSIMKLVVYVCAATVLEPDTFAQTLQHKLGQHMQTYLMSAPNCHVHRPCLTLLLNNAVPLPPQLAIPHLMPCQPRLHITATYGTLHSLHARQAPHAMCLASTRSQYSMVC